MIVFSFFIINSFKSTCFNLLDPLSIPLIYII
nr:MAG TPA: hypothetical protein [Caudoviricetes sp.]